MEKVHTTNYFNTLIAVAEDCPASRGEMPPERGAARSVATIQFELIYDHPYRFTSDDVVFEVHAVRNGLSGDSLKTERGIFFAKGQPCLRCSPLAKRYGWGIHSDEQGRVALYGMETPEYRAFLRDKKLQVVKAMRSKKAGR
ncbi:DUF6157 family protein [Compostibacter hankyongensis]|uniref:DUF6157 family protein n=1 Tax=Compostibacter hankyongensis TaxID=1007089 RepID=A0ABP8G4L0_9BACT